MLRNVPAPGGIATVDIGRVQRLRLVRATVSFGPQVVLAAKAKTLLKPDLSLTRAYAGRSAVVGRPFFVVAIVHNRTKDVGLGAVVTVSAVGAPLATKTVKVGPRRRVVLQLPVTLAQLGTTALTVTVTPSSPIETTVKNNTRGLAVETAEFRLQESATLRPGHGVLSESLGRRVRRCGRGCPPDESRRGRGAGVWPIRVQALPPVAHRTATRGSHHPHQREDRGL